MGLASLGPGRSPVLALQSSLQPAKPCAAELVPGHRAQAEIPAGTARRRVSLTSPWACGHNSAVRVMTAACVVPLPPPGFPLIAEWVSGGGQCLRV